jgi:hypothetical protein
MLEDFDEVTAWARSLREFVQNHDLTCDWTTVRHRRLGEQAIARAVVVPDLERYLGLVRRTAVFARIDESVVATIALFPHLGHWVGEHLGLIERHIDIWPALLKVAAQFRDNPCPMVHIRELDLPGVDSKFVELHRAVLSVLLDAAVPAARVLDARDGTPRDLTTFCRWYGLRYDEPLVRFRWLDPDLAGKTLGVRDLSMPVSEFARADLPVDILFITENKTNGLSFPPVSHAAVIFGLGYGVASLANVPWLACKRLFYWGDLDTHGFTILARLRRFLPDVRSFLMDEATLLAHRELWAREDVPETRADVEGLLTPAENALLAKLRGHSFGDHVRLEQERVRTAWVKERLSELGRGTMDEA